MPKEDFTPECPPLHQGFPPALRGHLPFFDDILISDITLREGEQAADLAFTRKEKIELAWKLADIGVHRIQIGFAGSDTDRHVVRQLEVDRFPMPLELLCTGFSPSADSNIVLAIDAGADVINIFHRSSDQQLEDGLGITREEMLEQSIALVTLADRHGAPRITFTTSYATQADPQFLKQVCQAVVEAGADELALPDSLGVASPWYYYALVRDVRRVANVPIGVHCHNDFGLALTNTLAGLEAGATVAEVTVNGLGERAGNTALDELFVTLRCLYGVELGLKGDQMTQLAHDLAELTGIVVPPMKPVTGANVFAQKLEIHAEVATRIPELYQTFSPELVGQKPSLRIGKGSGPEAVKAKLTELGYKASYEQVTELVRLVNQWAEQHHSSLNDQQFIEVVELIGVQQIAAN